MLAVVLSLLGGIYIGYKYQTLEAAVKRIQTVLEARRKPPTDKPDSIVLDPDDYAQQVKFEHEKKMRQLNPELDEEDL